ncbi:Ribonuclease/ribotoxin [Xylariales sp. PMI_506]|nr:Ribonuclease/ribotoxin [Xylariales sp. PMI_506]
MKTSSIFFASLALVGSTFTGSAYGFPVQAETSPFEARGTSLTLKTGAGPSSTATCPATANPGMAAQPVLTYTTGQLQVAYLAGAKLAAAGKTVGTNSYPHVFGNSEKLPFSGCGSNLMEFPIQSSGVAYSGEDTRTLPDRVVFEYSKSSKYFTVQYCGVMRHGPARPFLSCPSN